MNGILTTAPAVFAVGENYQIVVPVTCPALMWVRVGEEEYYDASNGIMRTAKNLHKITVPAKALDDAKGYTLCWRKMIDRKPYFPETEEQEEVFFFFRPLSGERLCAYHVADTHNRVAEPVRAAKAFSDAKGSLDFLIMNGDIPNHSGSVENFETIYEIASDITKGEIPIVFARGNHDMRGVYAESMAEYTPEAYGKSYYTFRMGSIWGIVLDCGEDKEDGHEEYGYTVCCHTFRKEQTAYLRRVVAEREHEAEGVKYKIVVSHNPFTQLLSPPFNIEEGIYGEWATLLREEVHPDLMICGHLHKMSVNRCGCEADHLGQPCTVVVGSDPTNPDGSDELYYAGCGFVFEKGEIEVTFTDSKGAVWGTEKI